MGGHLIAERQWRAICALAVVFAIGLSATIVVGGTAMMVDYVRRSGLLGGGDGTWMSISSWLALGPLNLSLNAFVARPLVLMFGFPLPASARIL